MVVSLVAEAVPLCKVNVNLVPLCVPLFADENAEGEYKRLDFSEIMMVPIKK
jgi:hypothetical protein